MAPSTQILLFDGFDELDAVAPLEILVGAGFPTQLVTLTGTEAQVEGNHGLRVGIDGALTSDPRGLLVVPGGGWVGGRQGVRRAVEDGAVPDAVAAAHAAGATIASICTGGVIVAAAGLLVGRPAVTHRAALDYLAQAGADVRADARVVDDGDILTAGGVTAGIDLSLYLVERFISAEAAATQATRIEHDRRGDVLVETT